MQAMRSAKCIKWRKLNHAPAVQQGPAELGGVGGTSGHQPLLVKVLFTDRCRRQNFHPSLLRLVDRLNTVIHKTQKTIGQKFCHLQRSMNSTLGIKCNSRSKAWLHFPICFKSKATKKSSKNYKKGDHRIFLNIT